MPSPPTRSDNRRYPATATGALSRFRAVCRAITAHSHPRVTIDPEGDHAVWHTTCTNPELYAWLFQYALPHVKTA